MAWTYHDWASRQDVATATGVDVGANQITFSGDLLPLVKPGDRVSYSSDTGGGNGSYVVQSVAYTPDATTITFTYAPTGASGDGTVVLPVTNASKLKYIRLHIAEVTAQMTQNVSADGVSIASGALQPYLDGLISMERRLNGSNRGLYRGRVMSHQGGR